MTSNRPTSQNQLVLSCIEKTFAGSTPELLPEQSVPAVVEKPALDKLSENLMEQIVDRENMETA